MAGRRPAPPDKSPQRGTSRIPWRALGLGSSGIGGLAAAYYSHPLVGLAIVICEATVATTIIATALFGSATTSDRAFRFLRWLGNRPEPDAPSTQIRRTTQRRQISTRADGTVTRRRARMAALTPPARPRPRLPQSP